MNNTTFGKNLTIFLILKKMKHIIVCRKTFKVLTGNNVVIDTNDPDFFFYLDLTQ